LATGQEHYRANFLWNDLGFKEHFKEIFYSAKLGHLMNKPEFFETINRMLDILPPERPLYFDDQMEIVALACEAGWDASMFESAEDVVNHRQIRDFLTE
jgi:putative hydrolase of the HAD superfamily